jgi:hypothetical protein
MSPTLILVILRNRAFLDLIGPRASCALILERMSAQDARGPMTALVG